VVTSDVCASQTTPSSARQNEFEPSLLPRSATLTAASEAPLRWAPQATTPNIPNTAASEATLQSAPQAAMPNIPRTTPYAQQAKRRCNGRVAVDVPA
jgi:hypothetical protein